MKFVDQVRIHARAGDGGNGCCSFRREKFVPKGGPDGGDGGDGGSIVLVADSNTDNLSALYYDPNLRAGRGMHGQGKKKHGRNGETARICVPVGTLVYALPDEAGLRVAAVDPDGPADEPRRAPRLDLRALTPMADLSTAGDQFVLCAGGRGGKGNVHFKSSTNRVPRQTTDGEPGEEGWFALELRTIADAGLVGPPNAGKSTLLGAVSRAHPKVAAYPFTTLNPIVGVVETGAYTHATVADIPGLIEGAHENRGLGHEFLRHILRCRVLFFVVDMSSSDGRDPVSDFRALRREIKLYDPLLVKKPAVIVANKMDAPNAQEALRVFRQKVRGYRILPLSAREGTGLDGFREALWQYLA